MESHFLLFITLVKNLKLLTCNSTDYIEILKRYASQELLSTVFITDFVFQRPVR